MQSFRELQVWQKGHALTLVVCKAAATVSRSERYGITSQLRRSAASIGANNAEGCGRVGGADFARFLQVSMGSTSELEYHRLLARDLHLITEEVYQNLNEHITDVKRMLAALTQTVRGSGPPRK